MGSIKNNEEAINAVQAVLSVLGAMQVQGIHNCRCVVACSNDLNRLIEYLSKGGAEDGELHTESKSD